MTSSDDERISYLAGEPAGALDAQERRRLDELRAVLQAPASWVEPAPDLEDRVVEAIASEARGRPDLRPTRAAASWRRLLPRRRLYGLAAATAAAVVAVIVAIGVTSPSPSSPRFAMVVSGTPLASAAHGSATLTKTGSGWRIELSATGLPHLSGGAYYEAWLKNAAGVLVPVGTFNDARSVTLWAGVPVTTFRALTVTRQRLGAGPASSGLRVLVGTIRPGR